MFLKKLQLSFVLLAALGLGTGVLTLGLVGDKPVAAQPEDKPKPVQPAPKQPTPGAKATLEGGWKITSLTASGKEQPTERGPSEMFLYLFSGSNP